MFPNAQLYRDISVILSLVDVALAIHSEGIIYDVEKCGFFSVVIFSAHKVNVFLTSCGCPIYFRWRKSVWVKTYPCTVRYLPVYWTAVMMNRMVTSGEHHIMMTSSNGNIFRVTGHLCGEFTALRWIPRTKASDAELWCFLWSAPE